MPLNSCALCKTEKNLVRGHFIPISIIKKLSPDKEHELSVLSGGPPKVLSRDLCQFLLCPDCENEFYINGVRYFSENALSNKRFSTLDDWRPPSLMTQMARKLGHARNMTLTPNLLGSYERKQLLYFSASVFWRSTFKWPGVAATNISEELRDGLRKFLISPENEPSFRIIISLFPFPNRYSSFPSKLRSPGNVAEYFFCLEAYTFTLISTEDMQSLFYGNNFSDPLLFSRDDVRMYRYRQVIELNHVKKETGTGITMFHR